MMRKALVLLTFISLLTSCAEVGKDIVRPTKNVILMVPDGASTSLLSLSRWYGRYMGDPDFELNIDEHICGMMSSTMSDGIIPCSAAAMSAIVTGVPQRGGNVSVCPLRHPGQDICEVDPEMTYQPLVTLLEAARLDREAAVGMVVTVAFHHATPAACASHSMKRNDTLAISKQIASNGLDLMFGGPGKSFGKEMRELLLENDVTLLEDEIEAFRKYDADKPVWAFFGENLVDYDLDRDTAKTPSLAEMTAKAIEILSKNRNGFFLMVEGSKIDYAAHANDPNAVITEFLAFDKAVGVAMDFAEKDGNTTVVVVPDHGNGGITAGDREYRGCSWKGIDSIYVNMRDYKATYYKLEKILSKCRKDEIRPLFKEWTGIDLTAEELDRLVSFSGVEESDYMQVANTYNFQSVISSILKSRTHIGFVSSAHTCEDVFLAAYHPEGDVPHGIITNVELNAYLCKVLGLKTSLSELTEEYYVRHDRLFDGYEYEVLDDKARPALVVHADSGDIVVPAWRNVITVAGKQHKLPVPAVYIRENRMFYLPKQVMEF